MFMMDNWSEAIQSAISVKRPADIYKQTTIVHSISFCVTSRSTNALQYSTDNPLQSLAYICAHTVLFVKVEIYLAELCMCCTEMEADDELLAENKLTMGIYV